jgi:chromosome partitioning protein
MLTILVTNVKGGCGKTTVATNLAGALVKAGFPTLLADCDRQKSSLTWGARRPKGAPEIRMANWSKAATSPPKGIQRTVIDAPPALRRKQIADLVRVSDIIILPVLPSLFDEDATRRFLRVLDKLKPIRKNRRTVMIVGNRIRPRTTAAAQLEKFFGELGHQTVAHLRDTQFYATAAASGLSLFDLKSKRAEGFAADWHPLLRIIGKEGAARGV